MKNNRSSDQNVLIFYSCVKFSIILPLFPLSSQHKFLLITQLYLYNPIHTYVITIEFTSKYITEQEIQLYLVVISIYPVEYYLANK